MPAHHLPADPNSSGIASAELLQWAHLTAHLAEWITGAARVVAADHQQRYPHGPTLLDHAWALHDINQRILTLLHQDPQGVG
jgi:hypothetical protein